MGVPYVIRSRHYGYWSAVRRYRARKRMVFIIELALISVLPFLLMGDMLLTLADGASYIDEGLHVQCYSIWAAFAISLGLSAIRYYRHNLALSMVDDPVYRNLIVSRPDEMIRVVDETLGALHVTRIGLDPPARAYTNAKRFPKRVQGMFPTIDPDMTIVVYASHVRADGSNKSDVVVGPVTEDNLTEVAKLLRAVDERRTVGTPDLNVRWG